MRLQDVEEYAGLTPDAVRAYLERTGWVPSAIAGRVHRPGHGTLSLEAPLDVLISGIAFREGRTPQAILREVNPRMRKGVPSADARRAHSKNGGIWIATHGELGDSGSIVFVSFDESRLAIWDGESWHCPDTELTETLPEWSFWPCDEHGNKCPWPPARDGEG